jgi:DNA modification methylase
MTAAPTTPPIAETVNAAGIGSSALLQGQLVRFVDGDSRTALKELNDESVQCCVTSPPYFGLRDYGVNGQIGLEATPTEYVASLVETFREVRRVMRDDGTLWMNLGDSYANDGKWGGHTGGKHCKVLHCSPIGRNKRCTGLKPKDLIGIPWMVAFALREDGWYLRKDIIWHKPNVMPESVSDRPTTAHEYVFLFSKSQSYYYDAAAIKEPVTGNAHARGDGVNPKAKTPGVNNRIHQDRDPQHPQARKSRQNESFSAAVNGLVDSRNKRSVWTVPSAPFRDAHFATYPPDLIKPCIMAGAPAGGVVLDPFAGSGTTGMVAMELGRRAVLVELNPEYMKLCKQRCTTTPGLPLAFVTTSAASRRSRRL